MHELGQLALAIGVVAAGAVEEGLAGIGDLAGQFADAGRVLLEAQLLAPGGEQGAEGIGLDRASSGACSASG
ncbi:MAG: hypothetical protein R2708_28065 [Vicinamibacterales bacterium]